MPMYYFCLHDNEDVVDADGTELPDLDSARKHARQVVRELTFKRDGMLERSWSQWTMWVQDTSGEVLLSFQMGDVAEDTRPTGGPHHSDPAGAKKVV
jgi:hypothetical protein